MSVPPVCGVTALEQAPKILHRRFTFTGTRHKLKLTIFVLFCALLAGCDEGFVTNTFNCDGVTVTIVQTAGSHEWTGATSEGEAAYQSKSSGTSFTIRGGRLSINAEDYGLVSPGDKVRIVFGMVTVNDSPRLAVVRR